MGETEIRGKGSCSKIGKSQLIKHLLFLCLGVAIGIVVATVYKTTRGDVQRINIVNRVIPIDTIKRRVVCNGDTTAYKQLEEYYKDYKFPEELFFYAFVMDFHYNYKPARQDLESLGLKKFTDSGRQAH